MYQPPPLILLVVDPMANIQDLCRLCGSKTELNNRLNIFDANYVHMNLQFKLKSCLGFDIDYRDNLPKVICVSCVNNLENFSLFKSTCERTACLFSSLCGQQITINTNVFSGQIVQTPIPSPIVIVKQEPVDYLDQVQTNPNSCTNKHTETLQVAECSSKNTHKKIDKILVKKVVIKEDKKTIKRKLDNSKPISVKKTYTCDICSKTVTSKHSITKHILYRHIRPKKVSCKLCGKKFTKYCLNRHIKSQHEKKYTYVCEHCGQGFVSIVAFDTHVRMNHTNERPFQCSECDKKFASKYTLITHISLCHNDEPILFVCDICNKSFKSKYYLGVHKKSHDPNTVDEIKKIKCTICNAGFDRPSALKNHMRKHTGERPFKCKLCEKCYSDRSCLKIHMLTHTGERNHVCEICGSAFAVLGNLKIHKISVHEGIKMFECKDCGRSYTQNANLNIHLKKTGHKRLTNSK